MRHGNYSRVNIRLRSLDEFLRHPEGLKATFRSGSQRSLLGGRPLCCCMKRVK